MVENIKRSNYCGELNKSNVGETVSVVGWVAKRRNLGSLLFIDLRDVNGIVQILIKTDDIEIPDIRNEYILNITGKVNLKDVPNPNLKTGEIEIEASEVKLINTAKQPPFIIAEQTDALEDTRLKYRYLDLRRPNVLENFKTRAKIVKIVHEYLDEHRFIEVETPYLAPSTPEGARDYLVPSRIHKGAFYALPQSPQLYKQMLMVAGFERYYQIARCFRDEDLRADRQPDFTQIDIETSFLSQDEFLEMMEGLVYKIFKEIKNIEIKLPLRRLTYKEAVETYGSDKPDTRFDLKLNDLKEVLSKTEFEAFKNNKFVKGIVVNNFAKECSRKKQDVYNLLAKKFGMNNFFFIKYENNELSSSLLKFFNEDNKKELIEKLNLKEDDLVIVATSNVGYNVNFGLGALRCDLAEELNLIAPHTYDILWVTDFPLFEKNEETGEISPCHHPFTRPKDEDLDKLLVSPEQVSSYTYDIVMNGYEAGGGGLRIYDQEVQNTIFKLLGMDEEIINKKFGWFVESLKYGTPPHGGMAFGLERLTMVLTDTTNIRDVIAFPKNLNAVCPVTNAPVEVDEYQLKELGIQIIKEDE